MAYTKTLRTYRYIDKNPVIDVVRTAIQDVGLFNKKGLKIVATLSSLGDKTLPSWFYEDVRDPKHSSVMAVMTAIGFEQTWGKARKLNVEEELVLAKAWIKREKAKREKEGPPKKKRNSSKKKAA